VRRRPVYSPSFSVVQRGPSLRVSFCGGRLEEA
jgi:hypothetical protein